MIRNRPAAVAVAFAVFAAAGVCGVVAVRVLRAVSETVAQQPPPRTTEAGPAAFPPAGISSTYSLLGDVAPTRIGSNTLHLSTLTPEKKPLPVVDVSGTAELPGKGVEPVAIPILRLTADHATGLVTLP